MQKKYGFVIAVLVLVLGAAYVFTQTRLFKDSPNVVIILTDDMDMTLMPFMDNVNQMIGEQGATFTNFFVTTPACCPSRASILRGQYAHNTDILENSPGFARFFRLGHEENALPVWLSDAGYTTAFYGKYLNNYPVNAGREYIPPGWSEWGAFIGIDADNFYYNYTMNENGTLVDYGDASEDYSTDVIRAKSLDFIDEAAAEGDPFLLFISAYAPHGPNLPAPRHADLFQDLTYPQGPSFNEVDLSDKPEIIRAMTETGDEFDENDANAFFRGRARSLQAVDELVADVINRLEANGLLENTYVIFTSDNGFRLGEHQIPSGKGAPYEEDIRVPFIVRGPGVTPNSRVTQIAANIDLAPTIADMVSAKVPAFVDGRSFLPLMRGEPADWRMALMIEFGYNEYEASAGVYNVTLSNEALLPDPETDNLLAGVGGGSFRGIRTEDFVFIQYENGELEYYDLKADPYQMENTAGALAPTVRAALLEWLEKFKTCEAQTCRDLEASVPQGILQSP